MLGYCILFLLLPLGSVIIILCKFFVLCNILYERITLEWIMGK